MRLIFLTCVMKLKQLFHRVVKSIRTMQILPWLLSNVRKSDIQLHKQQGSPTGRRGIHAALDACPGWHLPAVHHLACWTFACARALGTRGGRQGAAHGKKSGPPTAAHRQTSLLLRVLVRTSVALTLPETRASGRSANFPPSFEPHEEYLEPGSSELPRAGAGVFHGAARGAALGQGVLARGRRRQSPTSVILERAAGLPKE